MSTPFPFSSSAFCSLLQSSYEVRPPSSGNQSVHLTEEALHQPRCPLGMFLFILKKASEPGLQRTGMALCHPGSEFLPFFADILSRPLGVGCWFIPNMLLVQLHWNVTRRVCGRVRVLAPEPKPLERTVWNWRRTKALDCWRDLGEGPWRSGQPGQTCQCLDAPWRVSRTWSPPPKEIHATWTELPRKRWQENLGEVDFYFKVMLWENCIPVTFIPVEYN